MHQRMPVALFALAAILASGLGCARKADDAKISSEIQSKYGQDSGLSTKQLSVQASNGVVTISGWVDNDAQRAAAARQAAAVDGVKEVVNNLQVASASNSSAPAQPVRKGAATKVAAPISLRKSPSIRKSSQSRTAEDVGAGNDSTAESNNTVAEDSQESAPPEDQPSSAASSRSGRLTSARKRATQPRQRPPRNSRRKAWSFNRAAKDGVWPNSAPSGAPSPPSATSRGIAGRIARRAAARHYAAVDRQHRPRNV